MSRTSTLAVVGATILLAALALVVIPGGAEEAESAPAAAEARPDAKDEKRPRAQPRLRVDDLPLKHAIVTNKEDSPEGAIIAALDKPTTVEFSETPLQDALAYLINEHKINIWLDRNHLADEGVASDAPVTLKLDGVRLESVLNMMLEPMQLDWVIQDEVLRITTSTYAADLQEVRTYAVQNLLDAGHTPEELIASIMKCVKPGSWYEDSAISHSGGVLVVRQSQRVHAEIDRLLADLDDIADAEDERDADRGQKQAVVSVKVYQTGKQPADKVAKCVEELIAKDTWAPQGKGKLRVLEGALVVEQTRGVHQALDQFLKQLDPQPLPLNSRAGPPKPRQNRPSVTF